ncbi:MAG: phosphatase PAP2 family protein [Candidatus Micrarchaeia archaeon]
MLAILAYKLGVNIAAFQFMKSIASPMLNYLMHALSESYLIVLPLLAIYMLLRKDKNVYTFVIAVVLFYVVSDLIKIIVKEPRPCNTPELSWINSYACEANYSFPSNHATVLTGLVAFMGRYKYVRIAYIAWLLLVLFGRIYLGAHYFTDVLAGVLLSIAVAYVLYVYRNEINNLINKMLKKILPILSI